MLKDSIYGLNICSASFCGLKIVAKISAVSNCGAKYRGFQNCSAHYRSLKITVEYYTVYKFLYNRRNGQNTMFEYLLPMYENVIDRRRHGYFVF